MTPATLLLIDANSLIHRAFHALPPLTGPDGVPTQALYGLSTILLKILKESPPTYAAALFDRPEPTFRKKKYDAYKAQRPPAPDTLISQIIEAHHLFPAFGIPVFEKAGYEADDLIATFAEKFKYEEGMRVVILTGDMDTLQLVEDPVVAVRALKTGVSDTITFDEAGVRAKYGLPPSSLIDYKALVGDPSDNIKGLPGIGPKTAAGLLQKFGSVKGIYAHLGELNQGVREKFSAHREEVTLAEELVTLDRRAPVEVDSLESLRLAEDDARTLAYFEKFGFQRLTDRFLKRNDAPSAGADAPAPPKKPVRAKPASTQSMF